jgi:ribonuclease HI
LGKTLERIVADGISNQLELNNGLHWGQFGGRKRRSAIDAVAYVMNRTQECWKRGQIAGLLLMDVKGAFDHVDRRRLLKTMIAKKVDGDLVEWTEDFMTNRSVQITVDGYHGKAAKVNTGIPQGSPVSPILFAIYLSCLFPFVEVKVEGVEGISFADDVGWWVSGKDIPEIRLKLEKCARLSHIWAANNAVVFDAEKTEAILFSRRRSHKKLGNETIKVAPGIEKNFNHEATRWLGVWLDSHLTLQEHHNKMMNKARRAEARVRSLGGKFGLTPENVRKIQIAAVQAVALYGSELWWGESGMTRRMDDLQKLVNRQAQSITGMLKSTPAGPLVKEAGLRPAKSLLSNRHRRYATRAYGLPLGHPIGDGIRNPSIDKSIFGNLSKTAKDGVDICHSGQDVIEYTWMPACIERIAVPLIIESRDKAERSAATIEEESTRCIWTDGSRDELGNVGAAAVWRQGNQWTGLKFRLGRNKEVFDAELYGLLQATVTVRDEAARWISSGISMVIILSDSQAALHRIGHNGIGPGQIWAMAIIENTRIISQSGIKLEYRWVPGHSGIDGNETADAYAKDAAIPENEEALPSQAMV